MIKDIRNKIAYLYQIWSHAGLFDEVFCSVNFVHESIEIERSSKFSWLSYHFLLAHRTGILRFQAICHIHIHHMHEGIYLSYPFQNSQQKYALCALS